MSQSMPLEPGDPQTVAGYQITGRLGSGGQGTVFLGHAPDGTAVAVKMLHARFGGDATARARFAREIGSARRVASFCTARVLAADITGDTPYLVSEFIDGPALSTVVRESGTLAGDDLHRLAVGMATALVAIHQAGVVHRDLKPSNVLLGPQGPRLIDFGIARAMDATSSMTSQVVGTPAYMSPEQVAGEPVGPVTDVFAWGTTLLFAATGLPPFGQDTIPAIFHRILTKNPELGVLAEPLRGIVTACLRKEPTSRPTSERLLHMLLKGGPADRMHAAEIGTAQAAPATKAIDPALSVRTRELSPTPSTVRWIPRYPDSMLLARIAFGAGMVFGFMAVALAVLAHDWFKLFATVPAVLYALEVMWGRQVSSRPLRAESVEVAVDETGIRAHIDELTLRWEWQAIQLVTVCPLGYSSVWGSLAQFSGIYAAPTPDAPPLDRLTARRRFPLWGLRRKHGWELLLPIGRTTDPHVDEISDVLRRYAGERWTQFQ